MSENEWVLASMEKPQHAQDCLISMLNNHNIVYSQTVIYLAKDPKTFNCYSGPGFYIYAGVGRWKKKDALHWFAIPELPEATND